MSDDNNPIVRPMDNDEFEALETLVLTYGQTHQIIQNEKGQTICGKEELRICGENNIKPKIITMKFENQYDEDRFKILYELGKKNLNTFEKAELILKLKPIYAQLAEIRKTSGTLASNDAKGKTTDKLASLIKSSASTIERVQAIIDKGDQHIIEKARKGKLSVNSAFIHCTRADRNLPKNPLPAGVWSVVQVDFARKFNNSGVRGGTDNNYDTMTLEELVKGEFNGQNVRKLFDKDCVMFGWMQASTIFDAKEIFNSWGFEVVTNQVWDKQVLSVGSWLENYHEHLVIGRKGKIPIPAIRVKSIISIKPLTRIHSHKHPYFYDQIERMYPQRKYLDLFSRYKHNEKWTTWGNQIIEEKEVTANVEK